MWKVSRNKYIESILKLKQKKETFNLPRQKLPKTYYHTSLFVRSEPQIRTNPLKKQRLKCGFGVYLDVVEFVEYLRRRNRFGIVAPCLKFIFSSHNQSVYSNMKTFDFQSFLFGGSVSNDTQCHRNYVKRSHGDPACVHKK